MGSAHAKIGCFEVGVSCRGWTCFDGNTLVTLKNGSTQSMRNLKPGERILSVDRATGKQVYAKVISVNCVRETCSFIEFSFSNGKMLNVTDNHFMVASVNNKQLNMTTADKVKIGMFVPTDDLDVTKVINIRKYTASERWTIKTDPHHISANGIIVSSDCDYAEKSAFSKEDLLDQNFRIGTY